MSTPGNILIVDDDEDILTAGRLLLRRQFGSVTTCGNPERIPEQMADNDIDVVLLDMNFGPGESSGKQGLHWLKSILDIDPEAVVVMITAHGSVNTAVDAMKEGATDFIAKPWQNEKVVATISAALKLRQSRIESQALRQTNQALVRDAAIHDNDIIGESSALRDVLDLVRRAGPTDANVLILGENGTGKELIARELHRHSTRAEEVFLSIDMGSISESLFESELFGHRKGAFTDANEDRIGRIQAANGGTLFLDEIGNLPLHLQAKLLSVLEQRQVTAVGSHQAQPFDVRIIAATNLPANQLRNPDHFRNDLLFRLNTVEIEIPPLRERVDDIMPIARHYLEKFSRKYGGAERAFSPAAETALIDYPWPGNVRALRHAVERAVILAEADVIGPRDLQLDYSGDSAPAETSVMPTIYNLDHLEKETISKALRKHGFNISRAAAELGLTRASLYRRMEKHDL
ncbi:MAG: sigma-54-dependent Fis family transcriptional regulator [Chromatiales bacterium]|nr:MAG: sigma-54-dependent Fis family transcriptional regulator [Chromatiales bacterium]